MSEEKKQIWYHTDTISTVFYSIPDHVFFLSGEYRMERFDGVVKMVQSDELKNYEVAQAEAEQQLKSAYEAALNVAKKRLKELALFAEVTGKTAHFDQLLNNAPISDGATNVQEFVQDFFTKMNATPTSESEQQQLFKETFRKVPEIAAFFDDKALEKAAKDPEAWANEMYKTMFSEEDAKRQVEKREQLKETIAQQLKKNIEEAEKKRE